MKLEAMIWDIDGTLVDSEELHRFAFNRAFKEFALDWRWSRRTYRKLLDVTGGKERIRFYVKLSSMSEGCLAIPLEELHARKTEIFHDRIQNGDLALRRGVKTVLDQALNNGFRLAIATTTTLSNVETLFESGVLSSWQWEVVVAGDQVERKKPAPDVYLEALRRLNLSPKRCIAVEDSENGLMSALAAEIPTIITTNAYTRYQNFDGAVAVLEDLGETTKMLGVGHFEAWHAAALALVP